MNTRLISKWMLSMTAVAALFAAETACAKDIMLLQEGQAPDPAQVAAMFAGKPAPALKMRGIRVLSTAATVSAAQAPAARASLDRDPDCVPRAASPYKVRGVRLPSNPPAQAQSMPPEHGSTAENSADCFKQETGTSAPSVASVEPAAQSLAPESIALVVPFRFNSAQIADAAIAQLDAMAEGIKLAGPDVKLIIEGHTDAVGSDQYNLILSYLRASAVRDYLVQAHGIPARNLKPIGMGKRAPLNTANPTAPENRRVEFRVEQS